MTEEEIFYSVFSIIFVLLIGSLFLFLYIYIKRQIRHQNELSEIRRVNEANLLRATLETQENERERIGANLHDDIGPLLSSIKMYFKQEIKQSDESRQIELNEFVEVLDENIEQVRTISRELVPNVLKNFGLKAALEEVIRRFNHPELEIQLIIENEEGIQDRYKLPFYRIAQEGITNAIRHGQASKIELKIVTQPKIKLVIQDNGKGFDNTLLKKGLGLQNMEARAKSVDCILKVDSRHGKGTKIEIESIK